ncbi:hypothetical protein [Streptomyces sp. NPDC057686]|uniref:hypothetical protein n=1 Tax=Streptomyces sp. NPDC057686 TaxID=3346212 RepID=UPI00369138B8
MNGIRTRRLVLLTAGTALAAGTLSLASSASAAPATPPAAATITTTENYDGGNCGVESSGCAEDGRPHVKLRKYPKMSSPAVYVEKPVVQHVDTSATGSDTYVTPRTYSKTSSPALYMTDLSLS